MKKSKFLKLIGGIIVLLALIVFGTLYARLIVQNRMYVMGCCVVLICVAIAIQSYIQYKKLSENTHHKQAIDISK